MHVVASRNFMSMERFRGCQVSRGRCRILRFFKPPSRKNTSKKYLFHRCLFQLAMRSMSLDRLYLQVALEGWIGWELPLKVSMARQAKQLSTQLSQSLKDLRVQGDPSLPPGGEVCPFLPWFCRKKSREV